jgi:hypothetical protein
MKEMRLLNASSSTGSFDEIHGMVNKPLKACFVFTSLPFNPTGKYICWEKKVDVFIDARH